MGKITKQELSQQLLDFIINNSGKGGNSFVKAIKKSITINTETANIAIEIPQFNKDTDTLLVFKNSIYLEEGISYKISDDNTTINSLEGNWNSSNIEMIFNFVVLKNTPDVESLDFYTKAEIDTKDTDIKNSAQMYKLTNDNGRVKNLEEGTDLNTIINSGFYNVHNPVNSPQIESGAWYYLKVFTHSDSTDYVLQEIIKLNSDTVIQFTRIKNAGNWSPWRRL